MILCLGSRTTLKRPRSLIGSISFNFIRIHAGITHRHRYHLPENNDEHHTAVIIISSSSSSITKKEYSLFAVAGESSSTTTTRTTKERRKMKLESSTTILVSDDNNNNNNNKKGMKETNNETLTSLLIMTEQSTFDHRQEFLLYERLVTSAVNHHTHHNDEDDDDEDECNNIDYISLLNQILNRWAVAWKETRNGATASSISADTVTDDNEILLVQQQQQQQLPTPPYVLRWIDSILAAEATTCTSTKAPESNNTNLLQPNADTYRSIMDATLSQYNNHSSTANGKSNMNTTNKQQQQQHELKSAFYFIESLFQRIRNSHPSELTVDDFHRVMHACIYFNNNDVVSAEQYLDELKMLYLESNREDDRLRPTNRTYSLIIAGWTKDNAPRQATACLSRMIDDGIVIPQKSNFETCLNAWVKCSSSGGKQRRGTSEEALMAGERAENLLLQMQELQDRDNRLDTKPCMRNIGKVVTAWASAVPQRKDAGERALAVLHFMQDLDWDKDDDSESARIISNAYLSIIRAYSHSASTNKNYPEKCQALMKELQNEVGGVQNIPAAILRKLCSCLVLAWARSRRKDGAQRAEKAFQIIQRDCSSAGVEFHPDRFCYGSLLEAWSRYPDGERAQAIWNEMHREYLNIINDENAFRKERGSEILKPDTKSMNLVILAWSRSTGNNPNASKRAEELFKEMTEQYSIKPDVVTYNALLSALAGSKDNPEDAARRGEEYFCQLNAMHSRGDLSCQPTAVTYNQLIKLWSKVKSSKSIERAEALLDEMVQRRLQPNEQTFQAYSSVLACNGLRDMKEHELRFKDRLQAVRT